MDNKQKVRKLLRFLKTKYGSRTGSVHAHRCNAFRTLISCVLSQRTREENTEKASKQLFRIADTPREILELDEQRLTKLIKPAGFYRQKAKKIRQICRILVEKHGGKVPKTREELLELPGVGFKTSAVVMMYCFDPGFFPVDTHVNVISKRLGLVSPKADVEEVRQRLETLIPKKERAGAHLEMIHFGREICLSAHPKCRICPLTEICRYFKAKQKEIESIRT